MKKDIPQLKVQDLVIAIVPRDNELDAELWDTFIINLKKYTIENVLVNSRGYGEIKGDNIKTTVLRHFFNSIGPEEAMKIEPIQTKLFDITNEYWVSFNYKGHMYDKKYVFVKGSIDKMNFTKIPLINRTGVMIK